MDSRRSGGLMYGSQPLTFWGLGICAWLEKDSLGKTRSFSSEASDSPRTMALSREMRPAPEGRVLKDSTWRRWCELLRWWCLAGKNEAEDWKSSSIALLCAPTDIAVGNWLRWGDEETWRNWDCGNILVVGVELGLQYEELTSRREREFLGFDELRKIGRREWGETGPGWQI